MKQQLGQRQELRWLPIALFLGLLLAIFGNGPVAEASEAGWKGQVETMPDSGLIGEWTVRGRVFTTTNNTEFRQDKGAFAIGVCVEVEYVGESAPFQATKIATKSGDDCRDEATPTVSRTPEETETPDASATPSATPVPGSEREAYGRINRMPTGLLGEWVIGGVTYTATAATEFKQKEGRFVPGACVKVHYLTESVPFTIREIETTKRFDCGGVPPTGTATTTPEANATIKALVEQMPENGLIGVWVIGGIEYTVFPAARLRQENGPFVVGACVEVEYVTGTTPRVVNKLQTENADDCTTTGSPTETPTGAPTVPTVAPGQEFEVYGRVESLPEGLIGEWTVDGVVYAATESTEFKQEHGAFAVGSCVKIHAFNATTPATIREIETERGFHCRGGDDSNDDGFQGRGELYGKIQSFPEELIGEWNIGGLTFVATSATEFKQRGGAFAIGVTVKVHFVVDANGVNLAREIETKFANDDHGHDDDGNGAFEGAEGHAFGPIEVLPASDDLQGDWVVGGIPYTVNAETRLLAVQGNFAVGAKVRVKYFVNDQEQRVARKIMMTNENSGADDASHFALYAFVDRMPPSGFAGEWVLDNIAFFATGQTKFQEDHGVLGLGAYVKVEYFIQNGRNVIHELETQVPPGAGDDLNIGQIQSTGDGAVAAGVHANVWVIGGKSYTVTPATDLNDLQGDLTVGATALVNSYTAADGSQVATQISGVTLNNQIYLPTVNR